MVKDGYPWVLVPLAAGLAAGLLYLLFWPALPLLALALVLLLLAAFMAYFFRDPQRAVPAESGLVVSPADGRVTRVERLSGGDEHSPKVVSIFLSPFDVHVNRAPIAGTVVDVTYTKGRFIAATSDDASIVNEQNALTIKGEKMTIVCKQ